MARRTYDLTTKTDVALIADDDNWDFNDRGSKLNCDINDFARDGVRSQVVAQGNEVYSLENNFDDTNGIVNIDGLLYPISEFPFGIFDTTKRGAERILNRFRSDIPEGVVTKQKTEKLKHVILLNADEDFNNFVEYVEKQPASSFLCITRLFNENDDDPTDAQVIAVARRIAAGEIVVVDFTMDERRKLTAKQKTQVDAFSKDQALPRSQQTVKLPEPPQPGFSLVGDEWHRSGTVLLRDRLGSSYIVGQDEGTYFGCELVDHPDSVKEAFASLMPEEARGLRGVKRQGEWFLVPVKEANEPERVSFQFAMSSDSNVEKIAVELPVEDADSNIHTVTTTETFVVDGVLYARDPEISQSGGQHVNVKADGLVKFLKNTAVRSVSVEGVD